VKRILVIRGGAIGDFILTLPALEALRRAYDQAHIEILGYPHIAALADNRFYANAVRSIDYAALSRFFARGAELPDQLAEYFAGFNLIVSYLYDPDLIFQTNLERAGARDVIWGPAKLTEQSHAARQLAEPMVADLKLAFSSTSAAVYPSAQDREFAGNFLRNLATPILALHPGSGSEKKNWPLSNWLELGNRLLNSAGFAGSILIITGEADESQAGRMRSAWNTPRVRFARNLPLTHLAAILETTLFIGHDSGISHLAAAAGATCVLLFGPTNPNVWAPQGPKVTVLRAPGGDLSQLSLEAVLAAVTGIW
jgi:heptosyltransferase-2